MSMPQRGCGDSVEGRSQRSAVTKKSGLLGNVLGHRLTLGSEFCRSRLVYAHWTGYEFMKLLWFALG